MPRPGCLGEATIDATRRTARVLLSLAARCAARGAARGPERVARGFWSAPFPPKQIADGAGGAEEAAWAADRRDL